VDGSAGPIGFVKDNSTVDSSTTRILALAFVAPKEALVKNEEIVRALASHTGDPFLSTVYLDVDGRDRPVMTTVVQAFEQQADVLRRSARSVCASGGAVEADIARMRRRVVDGLDRANVRGIAMVSCSGKDFLQVVTTPFPLPDAAAVARTPLLRPLLEAESDCPSVLVALIDRRELRLLRLTAGLMEQVDTLLDPEPRDIDSAENLGDFARHDDELAQMHWRRAAGALEATMTDDPELDLVIAGPDEAVAGCCEHLSTALRSRMVRGHLPVSASLEEIAGTVRELNAGVRDARDSKLIEELRRRTGNADRGILGLDATLGSLSERRVAVLVISHGFHASGSSCLNCEQLSASAAARPCPRCGGTTCEVDDVVESAMHSALAQAASVRICRTSELEVLGGIGAIERY